MRRNILRFLSLALLGLCGCGSGTSSKPVVDITTSAGTIKVELDAEKAPITVRNFLGYVDDHFYDGTIFHRVIPDFMIQGGGFTPDLRHKLTGPPIKNEADNGLSNVRGSIAMARTNDLDSATAEFFINTVDNSEKLDKPRYAVFGKVIDGMDVVDKIRLGPTAPRGEFENLPVQAVTIKSIRRAD